MTDKLPELRINPIHGRLEVPETEFDLRLACSLPGSLVWVRGHFDVDKPIVVADEVTIIGSDDATIAGYGLVVEGVSGVLIRDLQIGRTKGDCITIRRSTNISVQECMLYEAGDGLLDINGGSKDISIEDTEFWNGTPRGVLVGNWQEPEDPPEEVFFLRCLFMNVPVRTPKINAAKVFIKDCAIENYRQYGIHVEAGSVVHIHRLDDRGGKKTHGPVIAEHGAVVEFLDTDHDHEVRWINPGESW